MAATLERVADRYGWLMAAAVWTAAFSVACGLIATDNGGGSGDAGGSVAAALFGQARQALGGRLYETADMYFHRGVEHVEERAISKGFFIRIGDAVSPSGHDHLSGEGVREMLPWLWMALKIDPGNVERHRVAAFWLAYELGRTDLARRLLRDAAITTPGNFSIQLDLGRLALREGRLDEARRRFRAAQAFSARPETTGDEEQARYERAEILLYVALLHEIDGHAEAAIAALDEILTLFPNRVGLRERRDALRDGRLPTVTAAAMCAELIQLHNAKMHACDHDHDHGHGSR